METWRREDTDTIRYGYDTIRCETIQCVTIVRETMRIRYDKEYDTIQHDTIRCNTIRYDAIQWFVRRWRIRIRYDKSTVRHDTIAITIAIRHDTIQCLVRRYDTMRIRYGYGTDTVRHDTTHWLVIIMAPPRLIGFVSLSSGGVAFSCALQRFGVASAAFCNVFFSAFCYDSGSSLRFWA